MRAERASSQVQGEAGHGDDAEGRERRARPSEDRGERTVTALQRPHERGVRPSSGVAPQQDQASAGVTVSATAMEASTASG